MRILLAVDGSDASSRATGHAVALAREPSRTPEIHVVYAAPPLMLSVAISLVAAGLASFHEENSRYAPRKARAKLTRSGVEYQADDVVAEPAEAILGTIETARFHQVIMGSHWRSAIKSALTGSVVAKVLANCATPLTIVR